MRNVPRSDDLGISSPPRRGLKEVKDMKSFEMLGWWLVIVGALNWGLVGLGVLMGNSGWNVVNMVFGSWPMVENVVYLLVGLSGVWLLWAKLSGKKS